jgi:molybdenum cofactor biosynthesis protein MoaC
VKWWTWFFWRPFGWKEVVLEFSHIDEEGQARMVDVSTKKEVFRSALAEGKVLITAQTAKLVRESALPKGNPFEVARFAGIQAAKNTGDLVPLCHPLNIDYANVTIKLRDDHFRIQSEVKCRRATGVEMEALAAVTVAALVIYDMCKAVDTGMEISDIRLLQKEKRT